MDSVRHIARLREFIASRNWEGFHTPKDLAMSVSIESAELLEVFQWNQYSFRSLKENPSAYQAASDEVADVLIYLLEFVDLAGMDLDTLIEEKMRKNEEKYPVPEGMDL